MELGWDLSHPWMGCGKMPHRWDSLRDTIGRARIPAPLRKERPDDED